MKLLLILAAASLSSAAKLDRTYLPPNAQTSGGSGSFLAAPFSASGLGPAGRTPSVHSSGLPQNEEYGQNNFGQNERSFRPERPQAAYERNAAILRQYNQNDGDTFAYAFEAENGIYAEENGVATNGVEAQGGYTYTGDDGQIYSIRYTADQNGFVPQGDHLPTPPPIPEEILKALEQNARDEAAGIYDDGSYNEAKYGDNSNQYGNNYGSNYNENRYNGNRYNGNGNNGNRYNNDDSIVTNSAVFPDSGVAGSNNYGSKYNENRYNGNGSNGNSYNNDDTVVTNSAVFPDSGVAGSNVRSQIGNAGLNTYLPPVRGPARSRSGFGRKTSFNARDGYQY
ncbi:uncharacterized protein [Epargyreus clarus]|uniref:uncharacterized protein n=1 Tax=Epargyreus clarus TaxID=520877 RepID=UPI003C2E4FAA